MTLFLILAPFATFATLMMLSTVTASLAAAAAVGTGRLVNSPSWATRSIVVPVTAVRGSMKTSMPWRALSHSSRERSAAARSAPDSAAEP